MRNMESAGAIPLMPFTWSSLPFPGPASLDLILTLDGMYPGLPELGQS